MFDNKPTCAKCRKLASRLDKSSRRLYKIKGYEYCATMGRVGAAHRDREEIPRMRSWKISRGRALKTTPERAPKPPMRIRRRGAPLTARERASHASRIGVEPRNFKPPLSFQGRLFNYQEEEYQWHISQRRKASNYEAERATVRELLEQCILKGDRHDGRRRGRRLRQGFHGGHGVCCRSSLTANRDWSFCATHGASSRPRRSAPLAPRPSSASAPRKRTDSTTTSASRNRFPTTTCED